MRYNNQTEKQKAEHDIFFMPTKQQTKKTRKWQEIEELKARQQLLKELQDIDNSFNFSLKDLI